MCLRRHWLEAPGKDGLEVWRGPGELFIVVMCSQVCDHSAVLPVVVHTLHGGCLLRLEARIFGMLLHLEVARSFDPAVQFQIGALQSHLHLGVIFAPPSS